MQDGGEHQSEQIPEANATSQQEQPETDVAEVPAEEEKVEHEEQAREAQEGELQTLTEMNATSVLGQASLSRYASQASNTNT